MILTAQIIGGVFGLAVAYIIDYLYKRYDKKLEERQRKQDKLELELYKQQLLKLIK